MRPEEKRRIVTLYEERLAEAGPTIESMGWRSSEQQLARFRCLLEIGDMRDRSVLDVGCGLGDIVPHLDRPRSYLGLDLSAKVIRAARRKNPAPYASYRVGDILEDRIDDHDYVLASGIFNFRIADNFAYLEAMLERMFSIAEIGVAVNMLSSHVDYREDRHAYYDPEAVFSLCAKLTSRLALRHDYMKYEFTVYFYKNDAVDTDNVFLAPFNRAS